MSLGVTYIQSSELECLVYIKQIKLAIFFAMLFFIDRIDSLLSSGALNCGVDGICKSVTSDWYLAWAPKLSCGY